MLEIAVTVRRNKSVFIVLTTTIVVALSLSAFLILKPDPAKQYDSRSVPALLATDMRQLESTTYALNKSLDDYRSDAGRRRLEYLGHMESLEQACGRISTYGTEEMLKAVAPDARSALHQSAGMCRDLGPLAATSGRYYQAMDPLFSAPSSLRRFDNWPGFSSYRQRQIRLAVEHGQDRLQKLHGHNDEDGSGSLNSLRQVLDQAAKDVAGAPDLADRLDVLNAARNQAMAARVSYWRTYVGIEVLHSSEKNILADICGTLSVGGNRPDACR